MRGESVDKWVGMFDEWAGTFDKWAERFDNFAGIRSIGRDVQYKKKKK